MPSAASGARGDRGLESLGATTVEVDLPNIDLSVPTYYVVAPAECSSNLSRFDGVRFGHRAEKPRTCSTCTAAVAAKALATR